MPHVGPAAVMPTDRQWFDYFREEDAVSRWDEVNFWRPMGRTRFRVVPEGGPVFFRLKAPERAIAGFGFFASEVQMSVASAWEVFGPKNGDPTFERFSRRLETYRRSLGSVHHHLEDQPLSCLILRDAVLRTEFDNGATYYQLEGRELLLPTSASQRPSKLALEWHSDSVFR